MSEHSRLRRKAIHTKNIMEVVNKLDEHELEKVSEMLRQSEKEAMEGEGDFEAQEDPDLEERYPLVEVDENGDPIDYAEEEAEEVVSLPGDYPMSRKSVAASRTSSTVAINQLQGQLDEERNARKNLEKTLTALKVNSMEMVKKLND